MDEQIFQVVTERPQVIIARKIFLVSSPLRDCIDDTADELLDAVLSARRLELPSEILGDDDVGRLLRPCLGNLDVSLFEHVAYYNREASRIEMYLESVVEQVVTLGGQAIHFSAGERIHTENSYKYTVNSFSALARRAGFKPKKQWLDDEELFSLLYFEVA